MTPFRSMPVPRIAVAICGLSFQFAGVTGLAQISVTSALYLASKLDITFRGTFLVVAENWGRVVKQ